MNHWRTGAMALLLLAPLPAQAPWVLTGRCVTAETSEPLPGCTVTVTGHQATGFPLHWSWLDWCDPEPQLTAADGTFRFVIPQPPTPGVSDGYPSRVHVTIRTQGRTGCRGQVPFGAFHDQPLQDLGELALPRGFQRTFQVTDSSGLPVSGAAGQVRPVAPADANPVLGLVLGLLERTDHAGMVVPEHPFVAGRYVISVEGYEAQSGTGAIGIGSDDAKPWVVVVNKTPRISGRIVDQGKRPVAGYLLAAAFMATGNTGTSARVLTLRSAPDGTFSFTALPGTADAPALLRHPCASEQLGRHDVLCVPWGQTNADVVVDRSARLELRVCDAQGAPLSELAVHLQPPLRQPLSDQVRLAGHFPDGLVTLPDLAPGRCTLCVHARNSGGAPLTLDCTLAAGKATALTVNVPAPSSRVLHVFDDQGRPVAGARVELLAGAGDPGAYRIPHVTMLAERGSLVPIWLIAVGLTDHAGKVVLRAMPTEAAVRVRVHSPQLLPEVRELGPWQPDRAPILVTLPAAGICKGTIGPLESLRDLDVSTDAEREQALRHGRGSNPWGRSLADQRRQFSATVALRNAVTGELLPGSETAPTAEGTFTIGSVPPGRYQVVLLAPERTARRIDRSELKAPVATVDVKAGVSATVELHLPVREPAGK